MQECEVLKTKIGQKELITVHCVLSNQGSAHEKDVVYAIYQAAFVIDGVKIYNVFGINATSGKCDREAMAMERENFYVCRDGQLKKTKLE